MSDTLRQLAEVLEQRKTAAPDSSYVASLYNKGLDAILKKIGEEATETVIWLCSKAASLLTGIVMPVGDRQVLKDC